MAKKAIDGVVVEASSILTALNIIKTVCQDNADCEKCPMWGDGNGCLIIKNHPINWKINEPDKTWKALRP